MSVAFGKTINGVRCSSINVEPFTPICSYTAPDPSSALTLDVPVPRFAPIVPPNECACFTFESGEKEVDVTPSCVNKANAKVSVAIKQSDEDCCTGKYKVTPEIDLEVPCIPFEIKASELRVHNKSGDEDEADGHGTDGTVTTFSITRGTGSECCCLKSVLDITLPDCVKHKPATISSDEDGVQVQYCERNSSGVQETKTISDFITLVHDPESCTYYPQVKKLEIPCCSLPDEDLTGRILIGGAKTGADEPEDYIDWELKRVNCTTSLQFNPHISCICPTFESTQVKNFVNDNCVEPTLSVAIARKQGTNCCDQQYTITPSICIPKCMEDDYTKSGSVVLNSKQTINWSLVRSNCNDTFNLQVPEVNCLLDDSEVTRTAYLGTVGGQNVGMITLKVGIEDCSPTLSVEVDPIEIDIPTPCIPTFYNDSNNRAYIHVKYPDNTGTNNKKETEDDDDKSIEVWIEKRGNTGCEYEIKAEPFDLTNFIANGGHAFIRSSDHTIRVDGTPSGSMTWHAGAYGDRANDDIDDVHQRGPVMGTTLTPAADLDIPVDSDVEPRLITEYNNTLYETRVWRSSRKTKSSDGVEVEDVEEWLDDADAESGDLSVIAPTGLQWHKRGIAAILSRFYYNESGTLSFFSECRSNNGSMTDKGNAALLSPAPSVLCNASTVPDNDKPASGLEILTTSTASKKSSGMAVKCGNGMRIWADGSGKTNKKDDSADDSTYDQTKQGTLTLHAIEGDFGFQPTTGRLTLNDTAMATETAIVNKSTGVLTFQRNGGVDCSMRIVTTTGSGASPAAWSGGKPVSTATNVSNAATAITNATGATANTYLTYITNANNAAGASTPNYASAISYLGQAITHLGKGSGTTDDPGRVGYLFTAVSELKSAVSTITDILSTLYTRYVHVGNNGIIMSVDGYPKVSSNTALERNMSATTTSS